MASEERDIDAAASGGDSRGDDSSQQTPQQANRRCMINFIEDVVK